MLPDFADTKRLFSDKLCQMKWSTLFLQKVFARSHIVHFAMYSCSKHIHPLQSYCEFCCLQLLLTLRRPPSWEWRWTLTSLCSVSLTCWPMLSSSTRCPGTSMTASSWKRHWLRTFLLVFFMRTSWQPCLTVIQYVAPLLFFLCVFMVVFLHCSLVEVGFGFAEHFVYGKLKVGAVIQQC